MTEELRFPLRLEHAFFTSLEFFRAPELPDPVDIDVGAHVRVQAERFPERLQVDLKVETPSNQPLTFCVELIGIFGPIENQPKPNSSIISEFMNERALHMLWPYAEQMIRLVTSQMGMNPLNIRTPYLFDVVPPEQVPELAGVDESFDTEHEANLG